MRNSTKPYELREQASISDSSNATTSTFKCYKLNAWSFKLKDNRSVFKKPVSNILDDYNKKDFRMLADINISRHKLNLISLFDKIKRLKLDRLSNRLLALEIQEELIVKITRSEQAIRKFKAEIKQSQFLLSDRNNSKETSKQIKIKIEKLEYNLRLHRRLIWVYKSVGDCIPFIYGNCWDLKQLFLKQDAGFISGKKGQSP